MINRSVHLCINYAWHFKIGSLSSEFIEANGKLTLTALVI